MKYYQLKMSNFEDVIKKTVFPDICWKHYTSLYLDRNGSRNIRRGSLDTADVWKKYSLRLGEMATDR